MPSIDPVSLSRPAFDNPFAGEDEGILAMPGDYTVELAQSARRFPKAGPGAAARRQWSRPYIERGQQHDPSYPRGHLHSRGSRARAGAGLAQYRRKNVRDPQAVLRRPRRFRAG